MTESNDVLAGEVSIEAELTEKGINAKAKSRALTALDRLIGNLIDVPGAYVERATRRIRTKTDSDIKLLEVEAGSAARKLAIAPDSGDRTLDNFRQEQSRKQANKDAVAVEALEDIKLLPPPEMIEADPEEIDPDWMNVFASHAEHASSERLRQLWGRVLAGEIRKPGSFSLSTLRLLSELDKDIAEIFQKYARTRLETGFLPKPAEIKDQVLLELTFLEEVGLLQDVNGMLQHTLGRNSEGVAIIASFNKVMRIKPRQGAELQLPVIRITRVGREIANILPKEDGIVALKEVAASLKSSAETIEIANILQRENERFWNDAWLPFN